MNDNEEDMYGPDDWLDDEEQLRAEHPGLKELWDQYQTMLKLVKPHVATKSPAVDILDIIRAQKAASVSSTGNPNLPGKENKMTLQALKKLLNPKKEGTCT